MGGFVKLKPSVIGMAALLNAVEGMDTTLIPEHVLDRLVRTIIMYTSIDICEVEDTQIRLSNILFSLLNDEDTKRYEKLLEEDSDDDDVDLSDDVDSDIDSDRDTDEVDNDNKNSRSPTSVMRKTR